MDHSELSVSRSPLMNRTPHILDDDANDLLPRYQCYAVLFAARKVVENNTHSQPKQELPHDIPLCAQKLNSLPLLEQDDEARLP